MAILKIENPLPRLSGSDEEIFRLARDHEGEPEIAEAHTEPSGRLVSFVADNSLVFPEAHRTVHVYVPKSYRAGEEARLILFQDGEQYMAPPVSVPVVLDQLIDAGDLAATIAVFVEPGDLIGIPGKAPPGQRSIEYDTLTNAYSRLLSEEILPRVESQFSITKDPSRRAICGFSSGAIAAFTVAWHRSDLFGCVISHCGSFTNLRGGGAYPSLIRTESNRPLRVFLQSGTMDLDRIVGNWAVANHDMAAALRLKRYDFRFEFGNGGHTLSHGAAILPQTLKWIFR